MNYPRIVFILNSNEFDGGSRLIYELVRELHRSIDVVIFIPIIPRYRLFVAENCKEMQPLKASIKKFLYCLRWVTLEIAYQKLNWVYDYKKLLPYRRCFFSPPKRFINGADKVVLNSWYHVFNFYELWRTQRNKFSVFHHHVENYSVDSVVKMRREIFESSKSITLCKKSRDHIEQERLGIPQVLFLGINDEIFNVNRTSVERDLRSTDVTLYRGFEKRKGFDYGLKSLQEISKELSLSCCVLQGSKRAKLNADFTTYSELTDQDIANLLRNTKIFVYPSLFEGFGLPPLEAMACGCAVVTTSVGAIPEYAIHMENAFIVESANSAAITQAIRFLCYNPQDRLRIQENAAKIARNYSWSQTAKKFCEIIGV